MLRARIAELLQPFLSPSDSEPCQRRSEEPAVLSETQLQRISTYIDMIQRWNARINLTAIRDEEEMVTRHFGESLFAARHLFPDAYPESSSVSPVLKDMVRVADLGSGAGFPGIPIKLWATNIALTLIESNYKKATFLKEVARSLALTNVDVQNTRAEALPRATFNAVTLRAVERFAESITVASNLLVPNGRLALLIGSSQLDQAHNVVPHLSWDQPVPIPMSQSRIILLGTGARQ